MPIRINLLAEQQAAEEARRRDPVKRAIWGSGTAVALLLVYCVYLQFKVSSARAELNRFEVQWKDLQPSVLQSSNILKELGDIRGRLDSLQKHSTNRFLWANVLNALQHTSDEEVRVVSFDGRSVSTAEKQVLVSTNIFDVAPKTGLLSWGSEPSQRNVPEESNAALNAITNRADLIRYQPFLTTAFSVTTNAIQIFAKIEVLKPETMVELVSLKIRARDYSERPGSRVDTFFSKVTNAPLFSRLLKNSVSSVQPESIQQREDVTDLITPRAVYIPFSVSFSLPERIRENE